MGSWFGDPHIPHPSAALARRTLLFTRPLPAVEKLGPPRSLQLIPPRLLTWTVRRGSPGTPEHDSQ